MPRISPIRLVHIVPGQITSRAQLDPWGGRPAGARSGRGRAAACHGDYGSPHPGLAASREVVRPDDSKANRRVG